MADNTLAVAAAPSLTQYINLANYVYTSGLQPLPNEFSTTLHLQPLIYEGKPFEDLDASTGFYGEAFISTSSQTSQLIVAFQGTNPNPPSDEFGAAQALDDAQIGLGQNASSYLPAYNFTLQAMDIASSQLGIGSQNTFLVGHSLGAAEAEYVASQPKTALAGVTFGTPGIVPAPGSPASQLQNYVEQGDPVGNYASNLPNYLSNGIYSQDIVHYGTTSLVGPEFHSDLLQAANKAYGLHTKFGDSLAASLTASAAYLYHPLGTYAQDLDLTIYSDDHTVGSDVAVCFSEGTEIRTDQGNVSVEALAIGDLVSCASGSFKQIRWLGHRTIDCRRHPRPSEVQPVRVSASAFGVGRPIRDLVLSPGHAICVDAVGEVLIPAAALVNGTSIVQERVDTITYWHVELEGGHDIILAENLPCESYIEMGNRSFFAEAGAVALHAGPDARPTTHADFCRPFHQDGPVVAFVRERLAARAPDLGWTLEDVPLANMHLLVDGRRIEPETSGLQARFLVPAGSKEAWLMSETTVPAEIGMGADLRSLGVCVGAIVIDDGFEAPRVILADDPRLAAGFHNIEEGPQRWTCGRARLPANLWTGCKGSFFLRVELSRPALPRWNAPASLESNAVQVFGQRA